MARASQESRDKAGLPSQDEQASLAILIHGDAAFPGEGIVSETLNISQLAGYRIGGAIHHPESPHARSCPDRIVKLSAHPEPFHTLLRRARCMHKDELVACLV